jgi:hypothetical protein
MDQARMGFALARRSDLGLSMIWVTLFVIAAIIVTGLVIILVAVIIRKRDAR